MQEQQHQIKIYGFLQKAVYAVVALDCASLFYLNAGIPVVSNLLRNFSKMSFIYPPVNAKFATLILIGLVAIGTKAKKNKDLNVGTEIVIPITVGLLMIFSSLIWQDEAGNSLRPKIFPGLNLYQVVYAVLSFLGAVILQMGADSISKYMRQKMGKDRWNVEEESFEQNTELVETDTSINIPYLFRYNGKNNEGWININPFRGTMVIGTPGSGKTFGVINPAIRQMIAKGFCLCIYDFKFPDLGQIAYYHYLLKKSKDLEYNYSFHVINLNDVGKSKRVNPFRKEYVKTLAEAQEMAEAMVSSLQKGGASAGGGSDQFFTQSAINFLSSCIYFFATHENGKYSDLPHILSFMNRSYKEIFDTLFHHEELYSLLSPFKTAYDNKAFDQLEGQVGTLKIFLSRLATKESFWVFSGDEVELKITDRKNPSIIILASDPGTQDINSALYSAVLNRTLRLVNSKHNLPGGIIADEFPTIYIHKIDNVVATARSNRVAVLLGLQELPQLRQFYKKEVADTISSIVGNIISGSARDKNTLDWLEKLFGKIKQKSFSQSISQQGTTTSINEKMEFMIPAGKIAALRTGEMAGMIAQDEENDTDEYKTSAINGKINLNRRKITEEENKYVQMPVYYSFIDKVGKNRKEEVLMTNFRKINKEVELIVSELIR
ncbi:type IV secretion system DNA-binding domain-containing protein [Chryseobacterium culicis]|uniref:Type IV secretion-system coupling protein DNA-binding domain-containing protein n=1 Tax=Chryseobacterium culicis TaxID=680127 RepID=A0A1H6H3M2_CHRCI|nr:type IV secretion system DNA-binding domain-containing protein [Chryseobacterium culicis]SEH29872.1 Type IV secretion-system coupling protein DNA-binding domain-containing protein [Chryseobacterium culicis]